MKIQVLIEDTSADPNLFAEHGLSVYIETNKHKILADTGASVKTLQNAERLGIDLTKVDSVFLSHGHYDHGGCLTDFFRINPHATVYIHKDVFGAYFHREKFIGLAPEIKTVTSLSYTDGFQRLDAEISLFSVRNHRYPTPEANQELTVRDGKCQKPDSFSHEQCLVVEEDDQTLLFSGCAHNGILNILDNFRELYGKAPSLVVSGFHMAKKTPYTKTETKAIQETAESLKAFGCDFYTGHCTGEEAYTLMEPILKNKLHKLSSGLVLL